MIKTSGSKTNNEGDRRRNGGARRIRARIKVIGTVRDTVEKTKTRVRPRGCTERERSSRCGDRTSLPGWNLMYWEEGKEKNGGIQSATAIGENRSENKDDAHHLGSMHAKGLRPHFAR
jgi:hypothetical protein